MRARYASIAAAFLLAAGLAAAVAFAVRPDGGPQPSGAQAAPPPAAPPAPPTAATPAPAAPAATPTPSATPSAPLTPTATATPAATLAAKRYDRLDATGAVATAGSWAILGADGGVLTTWEALRSDAATLRLHQTDAGGASQAAAYGSVEAGDLIEWRKADDCWVRYRVTGAPTRPASGSSRQEFPVEWMTYAATGAGCTGPVTTTDTLTFDETPVPVTSHAMATPSRVADTPVRHGPWLLHPVDWENRRVFEEQIYHVPTKSLLGGDLSDRSDPGNPDDWLPPPADVLTRSLTEAGGLQFWRDPVLPAGVTFTEAESGLETSPDSGYCARYGGTNLAVEICVYFLYWRPQYTTVPYGGEHGIVKEARVIDGFPALVQYSPPGPLHSRYRSPSVWIFDPATGLVHRVSGRHAGADVEAIVDIARSLLPE